MSVESTKFLGGLAFDVKLPDFLVRADVPEDKGGSHSAPDPHEYLEVALAGCTVITVQMYANRKNIPVTNIDVKIKITKEGKDGNEIQRTIRFEGDLSHEQKEQLFAIAEKCPIHRFLERGAVINSEWK